MVRSIVKSSNVYYYSLANEMGVDLMHEQLQPFGFGRKTGIDVEGEVTGLLPSTEWKRKRLQAARAAEVVRRRDHLAGHRPGLQQLHHAAAGQRHGHAGVRRPALQAAAGARDRRRASPATASAWPATRSPPLPLKPEHVELISRALYGVTQEGTSVRSFLRRALQERRQDRDCAGGGHQGQREVQRDQARRAPARPLALHRASRRSRRRPSRWRSSSRTPASAPMPPRRSRGACSTMCSAACTPARRTSR